MVEDHVYIPEVVCAKTFFQVTTDLLKKFDTVLVIGEIRKVILRIFCDEVYYMTSNIAFEMQSDQNTSTGEIASVQGTNLDFREAKCIGENIDSFPVDRGFDHNFILKFQRDKNMIRAADLLEPCSGRSLTVYTDQPAIQLYTANFWAGTFVGSQGVAYKKYGGVALETQAWPDSPNHSHFPDAILHPGEVYETTTIFEFGVQKK